MHVQQDLGNISFKSYSAVGANSKPEQLTRDPISIFNLIKEEKDTNKKSELEKLLKESKEKLPEGFKIGAAVGKGDCFFDSVAQGLNELRDKDLITNSEKFNVKSLREDCRKYAQEELIQSKSGSWLSKALQGEFESTIEEYIPRIHFTAEDIKNASSGSEIKILNLKSAIWGRPEIEGKMICETYKVRIEVTELRDKHEQAEEVCITKDKVGEGDNVVYMVNYRGHFVPLLRACLQTQE